MSTTIEPQTQEQPRIDGAPAREAAPDELTCPGCGAPAARGQLMCLECGARLALDYQRPPSWRLPAAIVGVIVLLAGVGVALALTKVSNEAGKTTAGAPTQSVANVSPADTPPTASTPAPTASTPAPAPTGTSTAPAPTGTAATTTTPAPAPAGGAWPAGKSAFAVVLASLPNKADADAKLKEAQGAGITGAGILHSDDYPTLRKGYWVVFDGQFDKTDQAQQQAQQDRTKSGFIDAYPRWVSANGAAEPK